MTTITQKFLSTRLAPSDLRTEISSLSLFEVIQYMRSFGWTLNLETEGLSTICTFKTESWADALYYEYGYICPSLEELKVLETIKKAAELCLRVCETFKGTFPENNISLEGIIFEDLKLKEKEPQGTSAILQYLCDRHKESTPVENPRHVEIRFKKFASLEWGDTSSLFTPTSVHDLDKLIEIANKELS